MMFRSKPDALTLIEQHMHDCETRQTNITARLDRQDAVSQQMHIQNTNRLDRIETDGRRRFNGLMSVAVPALLTLIGSLILEIVRITAH